MSRGCQRSSIDPRSLGSSEVLGKGFTQMAHGSGSPFDSYYF